MASGRSFALVCSRSTVDKAHLVKIVHPRAPGADHFIRVDERERCECHVSLFHLVEIRLVERQRAGGEVAGVCVAVVRVLERVVDGLEICVGDGRLAAHDEVALVADFRRNTADGGGHIGDVRADGAVAARQNARERAAVIRRHKRRAVELPREPNVALARPVLQFLDLFRLGERERGVLVRFLLPLAVHFVSGMARHLRRDCRAGHSRSLFPERSARQTERPTRSSSSAPPARRSKRRRRHSAVLRSRRSGYFCP